MVYSIEITNKNSLVFRFQEAEVKSAGYAMTTKFLKQSLPDGDAEDAIIINLGREKNIRVPFQLRTTEGDASNGTYGSTVKTIQEKVDYLDNVFITSGLEDLYTISIYSTVANITNKLGIVGDFSLDFAAEKPSILPGNLTISVGGAQQ